MELEDGELASDPIFRLVGQERGVTCLFMSLIILLYCWFDQSTLPTVCHFGD